MRQRDGPDMWLRMHISSQDVWLHDISLWIEEMLLTQLLHRQETINHESVVGRIAGLLLPQVLSEPHLQPYIFLDLVPLWVTPVVKLYDVVQRKYRIQCWSPLFISRMFMRPVGSYRKIRQMYKIKNWRRTPLRLE